jgi:hypothetical protein
MMVFCFVLIAKLLYNLGNNEHDKKIAKIFFTRRNFDITL